MCCTTYKESGLLVQLYLRADDREQEKDRVAEIRESAHLHAAVRDTVQKGCTESCRDYQMVQDLAKILALEEDDSPRSNLESSPLNRPTPRRSPRLPEKRSEAH